MIIAKILAIALLIVGLWLVVPAFCLLLAAIKPQLVKRAREHTAERPGRIFFVGLAVVALAVGGIAAIGATGIKPLAGLALAGLVLFSLFGMAGLATHIGGRLCGPREAASPWIATLSGSACLTVAGTFPVLGWFVLWPAALVMGAGATTYALISRHVTESLAQAPAPAAAKAPAAPQPGDSDDASA